MTDPTHPLNGPDTSLSVEDEELKKLFQEEEKLAGEIPDPDPQNLPVIVTGEQIAHFLSSIPFVLPDGQVNRRLAFLLSEMLSEEELAEVKMFFTKVEQYQK